MRAAYDNGGQRLDRTKDMRENKEREKERINRENREGGGYVKKHSPSEGITYNPFLFFFPIFAFA